MFEIPLSPTKMYVLLFCLFLNYLTCFHLVLFTSKKDSVRIDEVKGLLSLEHCHLLWFVLRFEVNGLPLQ